MNEFTYLQGGITAPKGFLAAGIHCGIRKNQSKKDLALICAKKPCMAAAVYTKNRVFAAPIAVTRAHLEDGVAQAVLCNSGIANACCPDGREKAEQMAQICAQALSIPVSSVVIASTGIIGQSLPIEPIQSGMSALVPLLSDTVQASDDAARAIMTTDTAKKELCLEFSVAGKPVRIAAISKGSGMIEPNMATMLCFITTDAKISAELLHKALKRSVDLSFNMLSVDGDTSTNDMACVLASGESGVSIGEAEFALFQSALTELCVQIAKRMAADGEGATRLLEVAVRGARDEQTARVLAKSVVSSSLVKTAIFGADANWGRILCALGYAGAEFTPEGVSVSFSSVKGTIAVCEAGMALDFSEERAKEILLEDFVTIDVTLSDGEGAAVAWGCDLSYDYVRINGDYRS